MRGGSQPRLVEGTDGQYYVAKFVGNPQGTRTLVNEWIAWLILKQLDILTPTLRLLKLPERLRNAELSFSVGNKKTPILGDLHLGSLCPVDPLNKVIFDIFPGRLLCRVSNLRDFSRIVVADVWLRQTDSRQAVFVRQAGLVDGQSRYLAHFIDHGMVFAGSRWDYGASAQKCRYYNDAVYSMVDSHKILEDTIAHIRNLAPVNLCLALGELPDEWFCDGDLDRLAEIFDKLWHSRRTLSSDCIFGSV
jgi:hypothetical protein